MNIKSKATSEVQRKGAKNGKEEKGRRKASKAIFENKLVRDFLALCAAKGFLIASVVSLASAFLCVVSVPLACLR
ncbi:MAG: hypothetical protein NTZ11_04320 [Gammaproteobacteria bacterium]|nr:hypothetical protein [Gammaproteobacteria bacterium]